MTGFNACRKSEPYYHMRAARKRISLFGLPSLCLSRACVGKMIISSMKWHRKRRVFLPHVAQVGGSCASSCTWRCAPLVASTSSGSVLVHASHWGNSVGWGTIYPNNTLDIHMVGATPNQRDVGPVTASPYPNFHTKEPAPPCTYWHSGAGDTWCVFPFCPVAEPAWEPLPRPLLPRFAPTWNVARSTIIQPCNSSGFMDPSLAAAFGIVSFDCGPEEGAVQVRDVTEHTVDR